MPTFSSNNSSRQNSEQPLQVPTPSKNDSPATNQRIFVDPQGQPLHICISLTVPDRDTVEERIREHGGIPTYDERKATIKLGAPGRTVQELMFSVDWVEDCIDAQQLIEHDTLTYRLGTAAWNKRRHFSRDDDKLLQEFVKSKKAQNAYLNGNKIYEELAGQHNQHSAQSWRERAVNTLKLTAVQPPYEASKAKREEARKLMLEKLATDKQMLEAGQKKLLDIQELQQQQQQQQQTAQHTRAGNAHKPTQSPPRPMPRSQQSPIAMTKRTVEHNYEAIGSESEEEVKQESSFQYHTQQFPHSQQPILEFVEIESTDDEDLIHKAAMDVIAYRRSHPGPQASASQLPDLPTSQSVDKKVTSSQKALLDLSLLSPSPPARSPPRALEPRDISPVFGEGLQQDQNNSYDAPSDGNRDEPYGTLRGDSDISDPSVKFKDRSSFSGNIESQTGLASRNGKPSNTDVQESTGQHLHRTHVDASLMDPFKGNGTYKGMGSDADDSDYSEPKHPQPFPRPKRSVRAARARPATMSPVSKRIASPESIQDSTLKRNSRKSLPNRSWNPNMLSVSKVSTNTPSLPEEIVHLYERKPAGTPTQDDLVSSQDPLSPSLPTWRNSPQAHLSIPDTLSVINQDVLVSANQKEEADMGASLIAVVVNDAQEPASVENTYDKPAIEDLQEESTVEDIRNEPVLVDWQDEQFQDGFNNGLVEQSLVDSPEKAKSHQSADVPEQDDNSDLTDEDDKTIEQRILGKMQHQQLASLEPQKQRPSSSFLTTEESHTSQVQEERDSEDDHPTYKLPAKLLSRTPTQRHQKQWSQTVWSGGMSFQFKKLPVVSPGLEGGVSASSSLPVSRNVSVPVSREVSVSVVDGEKSQDEVEADRVTSPRQDQEDDLSFQVNVTQAQTVTESIETTITDQVDALLTAEDELEDNAIFGDTDDAVYSEEEEQQDGEEGQGEANQHWMIDTVQYIQEKARVSPLAASSVTPKSKVEQDTREASVLSSVAEFKDVMLDYYSGEGDNESMEERQERQQLLLYLRDLYRKEIRTLMLHELVPALRSIDVLDACSGDLALARVLISKGMTEEIECRFWTRADDYKLFSSQDEDVTSLLERYSAVDLIQRTRYLTKTREEAKLFEVAPDAMEKSGLLKRARGRFGGREPKRQRLDEES
ncbi:hypothetical protein BGZ96_008349 [Linnemannia gamsii]|uniref:TERF2-interacting telomeric protein 1 Myb domain-containing protein n=1 Tax=Linnemannia gamsii TaxID=64522 RepID=A0ABQ7JYF6_9FUNG|nr:hypothetical protein BGZ96_008349 [Linnemannia gamsii]